MEPKLASSCRRPHASAFLVLLLPYLFINFSFALSLFVSNPLLTGTSRPHPVPPSGGDSGRGVALVSTLAPLDREVSATRLLPLVVADARGLAATATVTLTVGDVNDNPMAAAAKTISVVRLTVRPPSLAPAFLSPLSAHWPIFLRPFGLPCRGSSVM